MSQTDQVVVRRASSADVGRLAELLGELFTIEADFTPDPERQRAGLMLMLQDPRQRAVFVAERHGDAVGMATGQLVISTAEGAPSAWIEDVIVSQHDRGRGVGQQLVAAVLAWAKSRGATRCQLLADRDNAPALAFYARLGWKTTSLVCLREGGRGG